MGVFIIWTSVQPGLAQVRRQTSQTVSIVQLTTASQGSMLLGSNAML